MILQIRKIIYSWNQHVHNTRNISIFLNLNHIFQPRQLIYQLLSELMRTLFPFLLIEILEFLPDKLPVQKLEFIFIKFCWGFVHFCDLKVCFQVVHLQNFRPHELSDALFCHFGVLVAWRGPAEEGNTIDYGLREEASVFIA